MINQFQRRKICYNSVINTQGEWRMYSFVQNSNYTVFYCPLFSVSSSVSQAFLQPVLESFMNSDLQVRLAALQAIILILRQGLVHPAQVQNGVQLLCM